MFEGATFKLRNYFPFFFALLFVILSFVLFWRGSSEIVDKVQGSLTTIMGTIVGFYFGGKRTENSKEA